MGETLVAPGLICFPPDLIEGVWPSVEPLLRKATERTGLASLDQLHLSALRGDSLLWLAWSDKIEAAATTTLTSGDGAKACEITACGGNDRKRWLPLLAEIEQFAKREGCDVVRIFGRRGWSRVLPDYNERAIVLERKI